MKSETDVSNTESILRITWNALTKQKSFSKSSYNYDVYQTKRGDEVRKQFIVLAGLLVERNIDPSTYLKILSSYGGFGTHRRMPPPSWLIKDKAFEVFEWLSKKEKSKYPKEEDWEGRLHVNGNQTSLETICKEVKTSCALLVAFNMADVETSIFSNYKGLSLWFLAACPTFLRNGGPRLLSKTDRKALDYRVRFFLKRKNSFMAVMAIIRKSGIRIGG